jgi:hypothetical protein
LIALPAAHSSPEAALVLKLRTEAGEEVFLPISERAAEQAKRS